MRGGKAAARPDWKQYLDLGERLLKQPDAAAQCTLIAEMLHSLLDCEAQVWLAEPLYPLPGEPEPPTLPNTPAPELVMKVYQDHRPACLKPGQAGGPECASHPKAQTIAFPILSQNLLFGVLLVSRSQGPAFRPAEWNTLEGLAAHIAVALQI